MTCSKVNIAVSQSGIALLSAAALVFASVSAKPLHAQQSSALDQLTQENLIGNSVSLSNQNYEEIDKAIQRFKNNDSEGALEFLKAAKEKNPKLPPADLIFAKMYLVVRNANAARAAQSLLERAVKENPDDPGAYLLLAEQAFSARRITEAQALFELVEPKIEKFNENTKRKQNFNVRLLAGRAAVAESRQQWEEAQKWLNQWVELDPESASAHQRLGGTLFKLGKARESLEEYKKARELNPSVAHPYVALGKLFSRDGDNDKAQKAYERAYSEDKNDASTAQAYAEWLLQQNELDKAQAVAEEMLQQSPDSVSALMLDGIVAQMRGEVDRAKQSMTKILSLDPSHFTATNMLALLLIQSDDVTDQERALRYAQMNSQRFPDNSGANITRAWVLYRLGRQEEFQAAISKVGRSQVPLDSAFLVARIMAERGNKAAAVQELEKLVGQKSGLFVFRRDAEQLLEQLKSE